MSADALYFGYGSGGHWLRSRDGRRALDPRELCPDFPWTADLLDTGLLKNRRVPDVPDGRVHWTCGRGDNALWHAFFWWDRSGDKRSNSGSGFYIRRPIAAKEHTKEHLDADRREAFAHACEVWPDVVARQLHPLVLEAMP